MMAEPKPAAPAPPPLTLEQGVAPQHGRRNWGSFSNMRSVPRVVGAPEVGYVAHCE